MKYLLPIVMLMLTYLNTGYTDINQEVSDLKKDFAIIKEIYEKKIEALEKKIQKLETVENSREKLNEEKSDTHSDHSDESNFSVEAVLSGKYSTYTRSGEVAIKGFGVGEEGERGREGLAIDETEVIINSDIGDKFTGSLTAAIVREDGADKIELEEAYIESLEGGSLLDNTFFKLGRAFWNIGTLNSQHAHADDFADRPLPYRVFLNKAYNDDGLETSYLLPGNNLSEIGFGIFRGDDYPFGNNNSQGSDAWSSFYKTNFKFSNSDEVFINLYHLSGKAKNGNISTEDTVVFRGDSDLSVINLDYENSYTSNGKFKVSTEYFYRNQQGTYEDTDASTGEVNFDDNDSGYYIALVNQFNDNLSMGFRYSELSAADTPAGLVGSSLDSVSNDPETYSIMSEWKFDSSAIMRLQLNHEKPQANLVDNQFMFQYIMYLGEGHEGHDH